MIDDQVYRKGNSKRAKRQKGASSVPWYGIGTPGARELKRSHRRWGGPPRVDRLYPKNGFAVYMLDDGRALAYRSGAGWFLARDYTAAEVIKIGDGVAAEVIGREYAEAVVSLGDAIARLNEEEAARRESAARAEAKVLRRQRLEELSILRGHSPVADQPPAALAGLRHLRRAHLSADPGVYFLLLEGEVVYIGQAVVVGGRIHEHVTQAVKRFDDCWWIPVPCRSLSETERAMILRFRPRYNVAGLPRRRDEVAQ